MRSNNGNKTDKDAVIVSNQVQLADNFIEDLKKTNIPIRFMTLDDPERCPVQMISGMIKSGQSIPSRDGNKKQQDADHVPAGHSDQEEHDLSRLKKAKELRHSGDDKIGDGDYQGALEDLMESVRLNPDDSGSYHLRGVAYYELGRYAEAIADEDIAIAMHPNPYTFFNRAEAYFKTGREEDALQDLDNALKVAHEISSNHHLIPEIRKLIGIIQDKTVSGKDYYQEPFGWDKTVKSKDLEAQEEALDDLCQEVIDFIHKAMMIDEAWSTRGPRGIAWWGHQLAQRIWAERCRIDMGIDVTLIHAETEFLKDVQDTLQTYERLNYLNIQASQFAFVYDPYDKRVRLHTTVYVHRQTLECAKRLLLSAVGLQVSYAHREVEACSLLFEGSAPDISARPFSGYRQEKDEMVGLIDKFYIPMGETAPDIDSSAFRQAEEQLQSNFLATSGDNLLTVEFPFSGDEPVSVRLAQGKRGVVTSLFMASSRTRHPLLGRGLTMSMKLPVSYDREQGVKIAGLLNLREATEWSRCHLTGAWCVDDHSNLAFVSFIPAAAYKHGVLANHALSNANRSMWAAEVLVGKGE